MDNQIIEMQQQEGSDALTIIVTIQFPDTPTSSMINNNI